MKIPTYIFLSLALVWFGGAGLAFASYPPPMPACPCNHSHGESGCCCANQTQEKPPACSFNPAPVSSCACSYDRDVSSAATVTVYRSADTAIILDSTTDTSDQVAFSLDQAFPALPSTVTPFQPLRI